MLLHQLSLNDAAEQIRTKQISPVELLQAAFDRIAATEPDVNAFALLLPERAMASAREAEQEILAGRYRGPLHGIPVALKDLFDMQGAPTLAGSRVRAGHVASRDSACVERLRAAGAVILGKAHTHEFAYGVTTPSTRNPWNLVHVPGGSSGGSAAAVAAGDCALALGTDTGGSIRSPASHCGIVGLKPTYGRVSKFGVASLSWSMDHAGPMTRTVRDNALALNAIAGYDPRDAGSIDVPVPDYTEQLEDGVEGMRLGVPLNYFFDNVDPFVEQTVRAAIASLESAGALLREVEIPYAEHCLYAHFGIMVPESSAYHRQWLRARADDYGEDVRTFLEMGALIPATDYITSLRVREKIKWAWRDTFNELQLDAVVAPTPPLPASKVGQETWVMPDGNEESILVAFSRLTVPGDLTGLPAITVPCGATDENLPVGLQIIGRPFDEATVLRIARTFERSSGWEGQIAQL